MVTARLTTALRACRIHDDAGALAALIDAWRESRIDAIGDAIVALGPRAARNVAAPSGATDDERKAAWLAAARGGEPCVLHHLLNSAAEEGDRRLLELGANDPRPARVIASLVAAPKRHSAFRVIDRRITEVWRPLTALLVAARDGRALSSIVAAAPTIVSALPPARRAGAAVRIEALVAAVRVACESARTLAPEDQPLLDAILAYANAPEPTAQDEAATEAALLTNIYRDPADDGPRMVYADWLIERGRLRGEFIALQLASNDRDRAARLLQSHIDEYLGPLAPYVDPSAKFARGFVTGCAVRSPPAEHAAWATVTEIARGLPATDACPMPMLARASELTLGDLSRLAGLAAPPPLLELEVRGAATTTYSAVTDALSSVAASYSMVAPRLVHLKKLALHGFGGGEPYAFALHARPLEMLEVTMQLESASLWFDALPRSAVRSLTIHARVPRPMGTWTWLNSWLRITRDGVGWRIELQAGRGTKANDIADLIERVIAPLVARVPIITYFALEIPATSEWRVKTRKRLAAVLDAHPALAARDVAAHLRYEMQPRK